MRLKKQDKIIQKIWFAGDNKLYSDGESIEVGYSAEELNLAFKLNNYPEEVETFKWQLIHAGSDVTAKVMTNEPIFDNFGFDLNNSTSSFQSQDFGVKFIERNLAESDDIITTTLKAGNPNKNTKSIDVEWTDQYDMNTDVFERPSPILTFLQEFNKFNDKFGKVLPLRMEYITRL